MATGGATDEVLLGELRAGDAAALEQLFDAYADLVHTYCARRTGSWQLAEDATSSVFLEAWRGRARARSHDGSALPWLYNIALNVCRNATRSQRRHLALVRRTPRAPEVPDPADDVAARLDDADAVRRVLTALRSLSRNDQDVLLLVLWSELTYEQAAVALDVPVGTVRSRLSRARARLLDLLEGDPA